MSELLRAAEQYREFGWQLVPVDGKKPRMCWKIPPNWDKMTPHWRDPGTTGLAVILGAMSGDLVVRDFDESEAFDRWKQDYPDLERCSPSPAQDVQEADTTFSVRCLVAAPETAKTGVA